MTELTTREKLIQAALTLFSEKGYDATSVDEIAEAIDHDSTIEERSGYSEYSGAVKAEAASYFEKNPAESYLLVRTNQSSSPPIPLNEEYSFTVKQHDGSENVIHVGVNSFYMESSNCDNQNCVDEGTVTLDNMNERVLFNMILCLPHQLSLEMLTPDEAKTVLLDLLAQDNQENQGDERRYDVEQPYMVDV